MHKNTTITSTSTTTKRQHLFLLLNFRLCGFYDTALKSKHRFRWASMHQIKYKRINHAVKKRQNYIMFNSLPRALFTFQLNWLISFSILLLFNFVIPTICSIDLISRCNAMHLLMADGIQLLVNINLKYFLSHSFSFILVTANLRMRSIY